jgi:DNA adenine methylase
MTPLVKWPGGKQRLLRHLLPFVSRCKGTYFEPFFGGGAVFFSIIDNPEIRLKSAVLCDSNEELITCYSAVKASPAEVNRALDPYRDKIRDKEFYDRVRRMDVRELSQAERAARFIYLNRTCFNGLWRVNAKGQFNVPFGGNKIAVKIPDLQKLWAASKALSRAELICADFTEATKTARWGDFVYFDPPYDGTFTGYTGEGFDWGDQERVVETAFRLRDLGVDVLITNSDTPRINALYSGFNRATIEARYLITAKRKPHVNHLLAFAPGIPPRGLR